MILRGKCNGAKRNTEAWDAAMHGRRALYIGRSLSGSAGGQYTRENAGMSSENYVRIIMAESLRFPEEGSSSQG